MVCMIADYIINGTPCYNAFIVQGTNSDERALRYMEHHLHHQLHAAITQITVILGDYTLEELSEIAFAPSKAIAAKCYPFFEESVGTWKKGSAYA